MANETKFTPARNTKLLVSSMPDGSRDINFEEVFTDGSGRVFGNVGTIDGSRDWRHNDYYARLFAAAPDLFAACERVINFGQHVENGDGDWCITNEVLAGVLTAIRKAKGL